MQKIVIEYKGLVIFAKDENDCRIKKEKIDRGDVNGFIRACDYDVNKAQAIR